MGTVWPSAYPLVQTGSPEPPHFPDFQAGYYASSCHLADGDRVKLEYLRRFTRVDQRFDGECLSAQIGYSSALFSEVRFFRAQKNETATMRAGSALRQPGYFWKMASVPPKKNVRRLTERPDSLARTTLRAERYRGCYLKRKGRSVNPPRCQPFSAAIASGVPSGWSPISSGISSAPDTKK